MYFAYRTKPDIAFIIKKPSKYNADPQASHLKVAKQVIYYFKGTMYMEVIYRQRFDENLPIFLAPYGFIKCGNSNFIGDLEHRKSVMEYCFFLNNAIIS